MTNATEKTIWHAGYEVVVPENAKPYKLYGGEWIDCVRIEDGKTVTIKAELIK